MPKYLIQLPTPPSLAPRKGVCQLRVPSTIRLSELSSILIRSLSNHSELAEVAPSEFAQCLSRHFYPPGWQRVCGTKRQTIVQMQ